MRAPEGARKSREAVDVLLVPAEAKPRIRDQAFLTQWARWRNPDYDLTMRFDHYPVPATWRRILRERPAVQTRFLQAAWQLA